MAKHIADIMRRDLPRRLSSKKTKRYYYFLRRAFTVFSFSLDEYKKKSRRETHSRVVVIGGGVVGCSILYHLTRLGWPDVVLLERKELTAGSTWHAAGGFHTLNGDPNVARLQKYTIDLYHEIERITGDPVGIHLTGGINLAATDAWWDFLKNEAARHKFMGIESELISPAEIHRLCPIIEVRT